MTTTTQGTIKVSDPEMGTQVNTLLTIERIGKQYQVIWEQKNNEKALEILNGLKIKTKREEYCNPGDWNYDSHWLCQKPTVFWMITQKSAEKLLQNPCASFTILLD